MAEQTIQIEKKRAGFSETYPNGVQISEDNQSLLDSAREKRQAITFDEITLEDKPSDFHPNDCSLHSFVTRRIRLKSCGILSAAMDTVTEREMALAMAKMGGMGILHRNLSAEEQAAMVSWVRKKIHYGGMVDRPITFSPQDRFSFLQNQIHSKGWTFTSFPIVDESGKFLGMMTRDELEFVEGTNPTLDQLMKPRSVIVSAPEGTSSDEAYKIMQKERVKKLPIVTSENKLIGMYVWNDVKQDQRKRDFFSLDSDGHFLVGAAISLGEEDMKRADLLVKAGCKVIVLDSSHGACKPAKDQIKRLREAHGDKIEIIVGNIASYASAAYLLDGDFRPDSLKVGIGPGSICTTRSVTGHGVPQLTALYEVWRAVRDCGKKTGYYVPIIADGGMRTSGDIVKALAAGASGIMLGSALAGTDESPGKMIETHGKRSRTQKEIDDGEHHWNSHEVKRYKTIRGMGSRTAMEERSGSRGRYHRQEEGHTTEELTSQQKQKLVPEGVEGLVEYKGSIEKVINELLGGIQSGLAHSGAATIPNLQQRSSMWIQSFAGVAEGRPHSIQDVRN